MLGDSVFLPVRFPERCLQASVSFISPGGFSVRLSCLYKLRVGTSTPA